MLEGSIAKDVASAFNVMRDEVAEVETRHGFWDPKLFQGDLDEEVSITKRELLRLMINEKIALIHSELSEALEVLRKDPEQLSQKIPFPATADELSDTMIRILGLAKRLNLPIGQAIVAKNNFNEGRPYKHGKMF